MSEMTKIVQQQHLENKKLEKLFSDSKRQALQLSAALSQQQENPASEPWDKFVTSEVTGYYYAVARGRIFDSFGIYADVKKFLFEVNWVVGSLFKLCESYSKAHLYLKEHFMKEHPALLRPIPLPRSPKGALRPRPSPQRRKEAIFSRPAC
jgi:hypothetical protein